MIFKRLVHSIAITSRPSVPLKLRVKKKAVGRDEQGKPSRRISKVIIFYALHQMACGFLIAHAFRRLYMTRFMRLNQISQTPAHIELLKRLTPLRRLEAKLRGSVIGAVDPDIAESEAFVDDGKDADWEASAEFL
jgi:hypothetical protein